MRLIKILGLAAVAAVAAMAFVGATSASATFNTALCNTHTGLVCSSPSTSVSLLGDAIILATVDILCLHVEMEGTPLGLGKPQNVHILSRNFSGCGTNDEHDNCEVTTTQLPLGNLLKTGLDAGILTLTSGSLFVVCENIDIFGTDIECEYDAAGLEFSAGALAVTANEQPMTEIGSDFLCPNNPTLDLLLTSNRYILS
jgi:hypothetical protein